MNASAIPPHLDGLHVDVRWLTRELLEEGRVSREDYNVISTTPREKKELNWHPIEVLAKYRLTDRSNTHQLLDVDFLTRWLADKANMPVYHIDPLKVHVDQVTNVMSYAFAERHGIVAVEVYRDRVVVACDQPFVHDWQAHLKQVLRDRDLDVVMANPEKLRRYRIEFYNLSRSIASAKDNTGQEMGSITNFEQLLEVGKGSPDADDQHIVNIVDWILQYAFSQRASDIHLEPRRETGKMRFRIDGVLHDVYELPAAIMAAVTSRLKILSRLNVAEKRKPQDGRLKTKSPEGDEVELRISTLPTAFGEKMVMRVFDPDVLVRNFEQLGFSREDHAAWQKMTERPHGIIFVTGPTGSGKTTTLYSTLKQLATSEVNVCTIEDPIEMVEPSFNQMQVQANIDVDFAQGVKAMLRQDPDIIMIGEIRDLKTADMAIQAALTGHLVLSTLHTNDAPSSVTRLVDLGVPPYMISATVIGVMAQRLVRTLCPSCKQEIDADPVAWEELVRPFKMKMPEKLYRPVGCLECRGTGYHGRMGVYETMPLGPALKGTISRHGDLEQITRQALKAGMKPLRISGAQKVVRGLTTIEEVMRVTPSQDVLIGD
ncbi:type II secretion system protein [Alcanivorax hongdengensis A-11-3]|uniref:Type II secretion system protein n=1 Tax=Alcanivorax hongdengensis A-11-3 TaxID=1177179 RepID=L0WH49_9GAMM|nr:GspE/PulE family protein [Alcanivorax hongdengensis]EKF75442.1 type II secretion system protein [Alcanivorax hongdengensis A-11-3]